MMVQGTVQRVRQMAGRAVNIKEADGAFGACIQSVEAGLGGNENTTFFKSEESLSSPGDGDEDEDDDDDDDGDDEEEEVEDDDDEDEGNGVWKNLACLLCGKSSDDPPDPSERIRDEPHLCASCGQRFELIQHANAGEPQVDLGLDDDGGDAAPDPPDVKLLVSLEEADEELQAGQLECAECDVRFGDTASLERHAMSHMARSARSGRAKQAATKARPARPGRPFQCDVCTRGFNRKDKLKLHLMAHSGDKPLKCPLCAKAFLRRDHLKNHVKTHSRVRVAAAVPTSKCGGGRPRPRDGNEAEDSVARAERPFGCDVCGKAFSRKDNLAAHARTHTGEKPFACGACGKAFAERCALKRHMVVHTQERSYPCRVCGRAFARKGHLAEHARTHDERKPFLCSACGKAFARDRKLRSHMMTHSGERPHKCGVCGRAFARRDNLKSHQALHEGARGTRPADPADPAAMQGLGTGQVPVDHLPAAHHGHGANHLDAMPALAPLAPLTPLAPLAPADLGLGVGSGSLGLNLMPCPLQVALD